MNKTLNLLKYYLDALFPICRSITGEGNRKTLKVLQEIIPLTIHEIPSGTHVYDWTIPEEWNVEDAFISLPDGDKIVDFHQNNLHIVSYSEPVNQILTWQELEPHLHTHDVIKEAIPYRTSYYKKSWGFCVTHEQYNKLKNINHPLHVSINSSFKDGSLTYGDYVIPGRSNREILISSYICHPSMANDSLSGVLISAFLAQYIMNELDNYWSYRFVFVPETIGAIAYCKANEHLMRHIDCGLVITTAAGNGDFSIKQSFDSKHAINRLAKETLDDLGYEYILHPFDIHGSDERQYSSQGFRINCLSICRDKYYDYDSYHTSLDNLDFVTDKQIHQSLDVYIKLIEKLEKRIIYKTIQPNCELMLSKHDLYPKLGGSILPSSTKKSELDIILWLLFYLDGTKDIHDVAGLINESPDTISFITDRLLKKGLLNRV